MSRKILINGRRAEELRVAIVENQTLEDFEIETKRSGLLRNNIYRGVVSNIAPSLNAAFVDFGDQKNGFLAFNDVVESAYAKPVKDASKISDVLVPGQTIIVQVIKDATGLKGAQVTTNISLAGRYLVLRPKDAKSGVSRKVDEDARADLTQKVRSLDLPEGYGCIVRTNAMDQSRAILLRDAKVLVQLWHKIETEFAKAKTPALLYNDQDIVVQVMRDYFDSSINEVLIDDKPCYDRALAYVRATIASSEDKIKYYDDRMPLFTRYGIERQIEQIYARTVQLPSGGFIVIDPTEALTAIDVNSAHSTKRESQDLTAYHTNLEAAVEIGRQLRMRDIGGLIVIDFIDMKLGKHQRDVERVMRNAMARDKARNKVERISANGLLEINRQRLSQTLAQRTHLVCPTCGGRGFIPSAEAIGLNLIREIDARATNNNGELGGVIIKLHPDIAEQVQNERRRDFAQLENDYDIRIEIVASKDMSRGEESIEWLTKRQENELHPEAVIPAASDAASIVDVAEAYQSQENDDEAYRPNDYEEFSSDEAKRKRAARRSRKRDNAENTPKFEEPAIQTEVAATPKEDPQVADHSSIQQISAGLAVLAAFVEQMLPYLEDNDEDSRRSHRRFTFKGRRRGNRTDENSLRTDYRYFALDLMRAVCTFLLEGEELSRQDMVGHASEVCQWLMEAAKSKDSDKAARLSLLREHLPSHHAVSRISGLFGLLEASHHDVLTQNLIEERDLIFNQTDKVTDARIQALATSLAIRCAQVFNKSENAPVSFEIQDSHESEAEKTAQVKEKPVQAKEKPIQGKEKPAQAKEKPAQVKEKPVKVEEPAAKYEPEIDLSQPDEELPRSRRRARTHRRSILSPYVGENAEIITADVPIAPMTPIIEDVQETPASVAQAITQELPAVSRGSSRRVRRTRERRREEREAEVTSPLMIHEEITETPALTREKVVEQLELQFPDENTETQYGHRRERHTRRARIGEEQTLPFAESLADLVQVAEATLEAQAKLDSEPSEPAENRRRSNRRSERSRRSRTVEAQNNIAETIEMAEPEVKPEPVKEPDLKPEKTENKSVRRVRKTRAIRPNQDEINVQTENIIPEVQSVEVQPEPVKPVVEEVSEESQVPQRTRRVRRTSRREVEKYDAPEVQEYTQTASEPVIEPVSEPVAEPESVQEQAPQPMIRSRRTRRARPEE